MYRAGRRPLAVLAALALALVLTGAKARKSYEKSFESATRELILYSGFSTALILRGTYLDPSFRGTLAEERKRLMDPTEQDHARFVQRMADDGSAYHEVVFSADTKGVDGADKFGESDDGWVIRLTADGVEEALVTAYQVSRPSPLHRNLYLHQTPWSKLWIARFSRTVADPNEVVFKVGSGYGNGELRWTDLRDR